jgi:ABC-type transporter Mla subunit MlaD
MTPEPTLGDVIRRLDTLTGNVEQLSTDVEQLSTDVEQLSTDVEAGNSRFEKWDGRLWGLTLGLIGTAWTAIFAASAVVITRILAGT